MASLMSLVSSFPKTYVRSFASAVKVSSPFGSFKNNFSVPVKQGAFPVYGISSTLKHHNLNFTSSALHNCGIHTVPSFQGSSKNSQILKLDNKVSLTGFVSVRTKIIQYFTRPSEIKRIKKHGWRKRMSTRAGREIIMRRILKGRHCLTH